MKFKEKNRIQTKHKEVPLYCYTLRGFVHRRQEFAIAISFQLSVENVLCERCLRDLPYSIHILYVYHIYVL